MPKVPDIVGGIFADAVTITSALAGLPIPSGTAIELLKSYVGKKNETAREILFDEIASGETLIGEVPSKDEFVGVLVRYLRAAHEGAARINLRLLAKVVAGQIRKGELVADEFLAIADVLTTLSRDEIIVIGTMYRYWLKASEIKEAQPSVEPPDPWARTREELAPSFYPDKEHIEAIAARAQRSGLVMAVSAYGGNAYKITPLLVQLGQTVDFMDALSREGVDLP